MGSKNKYPLNMPEDFTLSENDFYTITTFLVNEDEIRTEIQEKKDEKEDVGENMAAEKARKRK